jgi:hypothetical protein
MPSMRHFLGRPTLPRLSSSIGSHEANGPSDLVTWFVGLAKSRTTVTGSLFALGVLVSLIFLWLWQPHRELSRFDVMRAPSRPVPGPMSARQWNHAPSTALVPNAAARQDDLRNYEASLNHTAPKMQSSASAASPRIAPLRP